MVIAEEVSVGGDLVEDGVEDEEEGGTIVRKVERREDVRERSARCWVSSADAQGGGEDILTIFPGKDILTIFSRGRTF